MERGLIATATGLFESRQFAGVVSVVTGALDADPTSIALRLLRARAHLALRRDAEAQADLREIVRLDSQHGIAYRLLGEVSARRNENESAAIFLREALRLNPGDREAGDWLRIVEASLKSPAAHSSTAARFQRPSQPRFAKGTRSPDEERPTQPFPGHRTAAVPVASVAPVRRGGVPEHPGFGEYLVATGIITQERLRAAQAYQRSMKVQLATAIVTLGLATQQRVDWAAVAHQSQLSRGR